jgi:hypothetical protein
MVKWEGGGEMNMIKVHYMHFIFMHENGIIRLIKNCKNWGRRGKEWVIKEMNSIKAYDMHVCKYHIENLLYY